MSGFKEEQTGLCGSPRQCVKPSQHKSSMTRVLFRSDTTWAICNGLQPQNCYLRWRPLGFHFSKLSNDKLKLLLCISSQILAGLHDFVCMTQFMKKSHPKAANGDTLYLNTQRNTTSCKMYQICYACEHTECGQSEKQANFVCSVKPRKKKFTRTQESQAGFQSLRKPYNGLLFIYTEGWVFIASC